MEKNKLMMIIIIAILAIMLGAVGFGFIYTINMIKSVQEPMEPEVQAAVSQEYDANQVTLIPLPESIKANLLPENDGVEHLALVSMSVALAGPKDATKKEQKAIDKEILELHESITSREIIVRNIAIKQLHKMTYSDLRRADGQEILSDAITKELQNTFGSNYIVYLYFGEYFLQ